MYEYDQGKSEQEQESVGHYPAWVMNIFDANVHGALSGGTLLPCAVSPELDQQFIHLYPRVAWPNTRHYSGIYARRINLHKYSEHTEQHSDRVDMDTRDRKIFYANSGP